MCNNKPVNLGYMPKDVLECADALDALEAHWARNNAHGVAAIWTTDGPRFFNMAQTTARKALAAIKNETGAEWATILKWVKSASVDDLH